MVHSSDKLLHSTYFYFLYSYVVLNTQIIVFLILRFLPLIIYQPNHLFIVEMLIMHQVWLFYSQNHVLVNNLIHVFLNKGLKHTTELPNIFTTTDNQEVTSSAVALSFFFSPSSSWRHRNKKTSHSHQSMPVR
jgi:hypothetical protein